MINFGELPIDDIGNLTLPTKDVQEFTTTSLRMHVVNEMGSGDFEKLKSILFHNNQSPLQTKDEYFFEHKMIKLGEGNFGRVYEFIGSDGYKYAVKIARFETEHYNEHDATILSKLQSITGYNKLFCYFEGKCMAKRWMDRVEENFLIMVTKKVYGFRISDALNIEFCKRQFFEKVGSDVLRQLEETIVKTYESGYIPSDIKSDNVMVDLQEGIIVIVDVGCYEVMDEYFLVLVDDSRIKDKIKKSGLPRLCGEANIFCEGNIKKYPLNVTEKHGQIEYSF